MGILGPDGPEARRAEREMRIAEEVMDEECERCEQYGDVHDQNCPLHPDYDPTPWCSSCGSRTKSGCDCGPLADND